MQGVEPRLERRPIESVMADVKKVVNFDSPEQFRRQQTRILRKIDCYYCEIGLRIFLLDFKNPMSVDGIKRYFAEFGGILRGDSGRACAII